MNLEIRLQESCLQFTFRTNTQIRDMNKASPALRRRRSVHNAATLARPVHESSFWWLGGPDASLYQISSKSVVPLQRYCDFSNFQDGRRRHLGFLKWRYIGLRNISESLRTLLSSDEKRWDDTSAYERSFGLSNDWMTYGCSCWR